MARRRAFLDGKDSMKGLKAREALDGYVHAGGKYYAQDGEKATELKFGDNRKIARGESSAQALLKSYTQGIAESGAQSAAKHQDPLSAAGSAVKSGFAAGAKTDFNLNNGQGKPQVGVGPVVKPEIVENADLTGKKGEEYLRKLDAGELF